MLNLCKITLVGGWQTIRDRLEYYGNDWLAKSTGERRRKFRS